MTLRGTGLQVPRSATAEQVRAIIGQIAERLERVARDLDTTASRERGDDVVYTSAALTIQDASRIRLVVADATVAAVAVTFPRWSLGRQITVKKLDASVNAVIVNAADGIGIEQSPGVFASPKSWTTAGYSYTFTAVELGTAVRRCWVIQ